MSNSPLDPGTALAAFAAIAILSALLLWPRRGLVARVIRQLRTTDRVLTEDALKLLFHRSGPVRPEAVEAALALPRGRLLASGLITVQEGELSLSESGRAYALHIVRAHRLWERYLADRTGVPISQWHSEADHKEHVLSLAETERLYERMGRPVLDPHGDPIPSERGEIAELGGQPLARLGAGRSAEIVHIEDEPDESYQRLLDAGLSVGDRLTVTGSDANAVRVRSARRRGAAHAGRRRPGRDGGRGRARPRVSRARTAAPAGSRDRSGHRHHGRNDQRARRAHRVPRSRRADRAAAPSGVVGARAARRRPRGGLR